MTLSGGQGFPDRVGSNCKGLSPLKSEETSLLDQNEEETEGEERKSGRLGRDLVVPPIS